MQLKELSCKYEITCFESDSITTWGIFRPFARWHPSRTAKDLATTADKAVTATLLTSKYLQLESQNTKPTQAELAPCLQLTSTLIFIKRQEGGDHETARSQLGRGEGISPDSLDLAAT